MNLRLTFAHEICLNKNLSLSKVFSCFKYFTYNCHVVCTYNCLTQTLLILQAAEKFKAPQPAPVIPEAKAAAIEQEEESEEEEVCERALISLTITLASLVKFFCHPVSDCLILP